MPLLYSIYTGRQAGVTMATALGASEKVSELSLVASAIAFIVVGRRIHPKQLRVCSV